MAGGADGDNGQRQQQNKKRKQRANVSRLGDANDGKDEHMCRLMIPTFEHGSHNLGLGTDTDAVPSTP